MQTLFGSSSCIIRSHTFNQDSRSMFCHSRVNNCSYNCSHMCCHWNSKVKNQDRSSAGSKAEDKREMEEQRGNACKFGSIIREESYGSREIACLDGVELGLQRWPGQQGRPAIPVLLWFSKYSGHWGSWCDKTDYGNDDGEHPYGGTQQTLTATLTWLASIPVMSLEASWKSRLSMMLWSLFTQPITEKQGKSTDFCTAWSVLAGRHQYVCKVLAHSKVETLQIKDISEALYMYGCL